jgi:hypothetical protein
LTPLISEVKKSAADKEGDLMAYDPEADLRIATPDGADLSIVWTQTGATISVGGDQPMGQPPCRITLTRLQLIDIALYIIKGAYR